uniref:CSON013832 protein n=1 Tax=Culicoides sonorensis TaxID=179676 RepID=A0A336K2S9_CULSO
MAELWNNRQLVGPPFITKTTKIQKADLKALSKSMNHLLNIFKDSKRFDTAAAYLSRIICINGAQFRRMELLRRMKQTNQALLRLKNYEIIQNIEDFIAYIPHEFEEIQKIHLPTQQYLEYILVKLQGISKLLCRVINCTRRAGRNCLQLVSIGNFIAKNAIFLSVLGEIAAVTKKRLDDVIQAYDQIVQFQDKLKSSKVPWLPENYCLPVDLKLWLGESYPSEPVNAANSVSYRNPLSSLISTEEDDVEFEDETKEIYEAFKEVEQKTTNFGDDFVQFDGTKEKESENGFGDTVEREESLLDRLLSVKTVQDIQNFIKNEDSLRIQRNPKSFTSKVPKKQWNIFKTESNRLMKAFSGKTLVKKFKEQLNKIINAN